MTTPSGPRIIPARSIFPMGTAPIPRRPMRTSSHSRWWTLITDAHYQGGGQDETVALSSPPSADLADANGDGVVSVLDLLAVIGDWDSDSGSGDVNGDGLSNILDLLQVIGDWGRECA